MSPRLRNLLFLTTMLAAFVFPRLTRAQIPAPASGQTRYKVVFTPTFGGTDSHIGILGARVLNNAGTLIGSADTTQPDPYAPDGCFNDDDCLVAHAFSFQRGQITDLGSIPGGANSETSWISPNGLIAGNSQNGMTDPLTGGWEMHGVLWKRGQLIDLGTLDGGTLSIASAVNSSGEVVGLSLNSTQDPYSVWGFYQTRAYLWKSGVMHDLGTLGGPDAVAIRINEIGQVAGNSHTGFTPSDACGFGGLATGGFLWQDGKMTDFGNFGGSCTIVNDLNNRGQVVGSSLLPGDQIQHPFLWNRGKLIDLGTFGGDFGVAISVNDSGVVVGLAATAENSAFHASLWTDGRITDLGALGSGQCSLASSVNSQGQVVGFSTDCSFEEAAFRAFISENGGPMVDLNSLIPPDSGVELHNAPFINDRGEIAAIGVFPDGTHAPVLLVPCNSSGAGNVGCENVGQNLRSHATQPLSASRAASSNASHWPQFRWTWSNPVAQFAHSRLKSDAARRLQ